MVRQSFDPGAEIRRSGDTEFTETAQRSLRPTSGRGLGRMAPEKKGQVWRRENSDCTGDGRNAPTLRAAEAEGVGLDRSRPR